MEFTPPASGSTRLSSDVWTLLCHYATKNGNSSTREALEQLVRCTIGNAQVVQPSSLEESAAAPPTQNAAAALDAVLAFD
ncbi:MAG: hypothetical protein DCF25_15560 [Leptolyngbya foveolarum]|uniref:Uncharacterized protein n=1 Tax=Leptolyngbya foveolarum TaxID=47253 RepID=A0A2W4U3U1_9CYAN|nr:MAG: hypothetical protein DCF25_15560 [Leptolyngbya foveolarum]